MTAINVIIGSDRATIYTDGAGLGFDGRLRKLVSKVRELPGTRCALAVRGDLRALNALARILPTIGSSYDQLHDAAEDGRLARALGRWRALTTGRVGLLMRFDLVVAGWSTSAGKPDAFMFCNHGRLGRDDKKPGPQRWRPFDIAPGIVMPAVPLSSSMRANMLTSMPAVMEQQRRHKEPSFFLPQGRSMVGGSIQETTITAAGVHTCEVGNWGDKLGQMLGGGTDYRKAWLRFGAMFAALWMATFVGVILMEAVWIVSTR